ncbi:MAG: hypothetical protein WCV90_01410 [Candidatus Woesearchaeota archaeon]
MGEYWDKINHLNGELSSCEMLDLLLLIKGVKSVSSSKFLRLNNEEGHRFLEGLEIGSWFKNDHAHLWRMDRVNSYDDFRLLEIPPMKELMSMSVSEGEEFIARFDEREDLYFRLLGIPTCCSTEYSKSPTSFNREYLSLLHAVHQKGGDGVLYSQVGLFYAPCNLDCQATKDLDLSNWLKAEAPELWQREFEELKSHIYNPYLTKPLTREELLTMLRSRRETTSPTLP